jgi:hypothetical protein
MMIIENMVELKHHLQTLLETGKRHKFRMEKLLDHPEAGFGSFNHIGFRYIHTLRAALPEGEIISATECATVGCIAGHAALLFDCPEDEDIFEFAETQLGLTCGEAYNLFHGEWHPTKTMRTISLEEVIEHLDSLIQNETEHRMTAT